MKWLVPFLFVSTSAFACVDLTGVYKTCERIRGTNSELNSGGFTIYKPVANGIEFIVNGRKHKADGVGRIAKPSETGNDTDLLVTDTCDEKSLSHTFKDPEEFGTDITYTFTKRETALVIEIKAMDPYLMINELYVCD